MTSIPGQDAVNRFQANEEKLDTFLNEFGTYTANPPSGATSVETVPSLMSRLQTRYLNIVMRGNWGTTTAYAQNDAVIQASVVYLCVTEHTSGTFATDLAAGKWVIYQQTIMSGVDGKKYKIIAGVIRNTSGTWAPIVDSDHNSCGITTVTANEDGSIRINHPVGAGNGKVVALLATPDETFAAKGLQCGCSVGQDYSDMYFSAPLQFYLNADTLALTVPSFFAGDVTAAYQSDIIRITHPQLISGCNLVATKLGSMKPGVDLSMSVGGSYTDCNFLGTIFGYATYSGSAWTFEYSNVNAGAVTMAWNTDHLTITHPTAGAVLANFNVNGRWPYKAFFDSFTDTSVDVFFTDKDGVNKSTPDTTMKVVFNRSGINCISGSAVKLPIGLWQFSTPIAPVKSTRLLDAGSNIWIMGIMEMP